MEKFDVGGYRDNLAKDLKALRTTTDDKEDDEIGQELAKNIVKETAKTGSYEIAKKIRTIEKRSDLSSAEKDQQINELNVLLTNEQAKEEAERIDEVENALLFKKEDLERMSEVYGEPNLRKCAALWISHSNALSAGWLELPEDDEQLVQTLLGEDQNAKTKIPTSKQIEEALAVYSQNIERISRILGEPNLKKCAVIWIYYSNDPEIWNGIPRLPDDDDELRKDLQKYL